MILTEAPRPAAVALNAFAPFHVVPNFVPDAASMRASLEHFFSKPEKAGPRHQVWNYWHVPGSYTYLRTDPVKVIEPALVEQFMRRLREFAWIRLGMNVVTHPYLSMYVDGCGQTLHNDSRNGAFGYVYSLTRWAERKFSGGETMLFREQDYWASGRFRDSGAGTSFYDMVPSRLNQLLLFDDRMLHGVPEVRGVSEPCASRLVLHGHMSVTGVSAAGPLGAVFQNEGLGALGELIGVAEARIAAIKGLFHGFVIHAVEVAPDGSVVRAQRLVQRVLGVDGPQVDIAIVDDFAAQLAQLRFAATEGPSRVVVPLMFA